jgi:hypothetical protein
MTTTLTSPSENPTQATQWTPADVVAAVRTTPMTAAQYADVILAIRESIPNLLPIDKTLKKRMSWAQRLSPRFVQSMATGLETSAVWQASADATPLELRQNLERSDELRPLAEQADALNTVVQFTTDYHHFVAADKARVAFNVGHKLGGKEGKMIAPHLSIARESLPKRHKAAAAKFIAETTAQPGRE